MNERKCCVRNCNKTRADDTILHVFPNPEKELDRFNKWMYAIGGNVFVIKAETVFKHGRVCHNHFDAKYYTSSRRLSKNAVPSLNIQDSQIALHWFPNPNKDIARFREWVHVIGGEIVGLSNEHIYRLRRVCRAHFEEKYCCRNNRLSNIAIPTLLLRGISFFDKKKLRILIPLQASICDTQYLLSFASVSRYLTDFDIDSSDSYSPYSECALVCTQQGGSALLETNAYNGTICENEIALYKKKRRQYVSDAIFLNE